MKIICDRGDRRFHDFPTRARRRSHGSTCHVCHIFRRYPYKPGDIERPSRVVEAGFYAAPASASPQ